MRSGCTPIAQDWRTPQEAIRYVARDNRFAVRRLVGMTLGGPVYCATDCDALKARKSNYRPEGCGGGELR
jgi:hypothetical protein